MLEAAKAATGGAGVATSIILSASVARLSVETDSGVEAKIS